MSTYPGGKNGAGVYQRLICQMPPHATYIEPFLGGGAIMRLKRPAACSIGIDADGDVVERWCHQVSASDLTILETWGAWTVPPNLTVLHADAIGWLASASVSDDTLIYLDPPYLLSTRRQHRPIYRYELSDNDHMRLLYIIKRLPCMVMISGYYSDLYASWLEHWRTINFKVRTRGGSVATEYIWMNYPEPLELHDYRYLGYNFRERERIKRKKLRWVARLSRMDALERHAMMSALEDWRSNIAVHGATTMSGDARASSFSELAAAIIA